MTWALWPASRSQTVARVDGYRTQPRSDIDGTKSGCSGNARLGTRACRPLDDPLAELVAVCDVVEERADDAAAYGVPAYYRSA